MALRPRMLGRIRVLGGLALLAASVAACSLIAGLTEDYRVGPDGGVGAMNDASGDATVDPDGGLDGAPQDGSPGDGGLDAPPGARFCDRVDASGLDFCIDFETDTVGAMPAGWNGLYNDVDGAAVKVLATAGYGNTRGLDVDTNTPDASGRNTYLIKKLPGTKSAASYLSYDVEFDVRLLVSAVNYEALGVLNFTGATPEDRGVADYPIFGVMARIDPIDGGVVDTTASWHHARITLQHETAGSVFNQRITIDGDAAANVVDLTAGVSAANTTKTELRVGIFYATAGGGRVHATFDNIVVWRK